MKIMKKCPFCGEEVDPEINMCTNCGAVLEEDESSPVAAVVDNNHFLPPETMLNNRYLIKDLLGQGGFGITYEGLDTKLGSRIAIKEYYPRTLAGRHSSTSLYVTVSSREDAKDYKTGLNKFLEEAKNQARFAGQGSIVYVSDYFSENNTAYIVMEYLDGITVNEYLKLHGKMTFDQCMKYMLPIMDALEKIHKETMIHRDISPSNIMILRDGRTKLLDFGSARTVAPGHKSLSVIVTQDYAPIEQYSSQREQGPFTDIFSLCGTIYTMLTNTVPASIYERMTSKKSLTPPSSLGADITPDAENALLKGLALSPEDRFQNIAALRHALLTASEPAPASEPEAPSYEEPVYEDRESETILRTYPDDDFSDYGEREDYVQSYAPDDDPDYNSDYNGTDYDPYNEGQNYGEQSGFPVKRTILFVIDALLAVGIVILLLRRFMG